MTFWLLLSKVSGISTILFNSFDAPDNFFGFFVFVFVFLGKQHIPTSIYVQLLESSLYSLF